MRPSRSLLISLLAGTLALAGCASSGSPTGPTVAPPIAQAAPALGGSSWTLVRLSSSAPSAKAIGSASLSFLAGGSFSGSTGCNSMSGTWTQDDWALTFGAIATTRKQCSGPVGTQEDAVLAALHEIASFTGGATDLRLLDSGNDPRLVYAAASAALVGPTWRATGINNGKGAVTSVAGTAAVTATFDDAGAVTGNGGCNAYSATYTTGAGNAMSVTDLSATAMACAAGDTEAQYFAALTATARYSLDQGTLTLRDAAGATLVTYASTGR